MSRNPRKVDQSGGTTTAVAPIHHLSDVNFTIVDGVS